MTTEKSLQTIVKELLKADISLHKSEKIVRSLMSFRHLFDEIIDYPELMLRDLIAFSANDKVVFPVDIVELRHVLGSGKISLDGLDIPLFSVKFANKYLNNYAVHLFIDKQSLSCEKWSYGGLLYCKSSSINLSKSLVRVAVNRPAETNAVKSAQKIVKKYFPSVEFGVNNNVPGISSYMINLASAKNLKKYAQLQIQLTPAEAGLFNKLKDLRDQAGLQGKVEMRVAGGWVRDKLLGKDSDDVDIAISGMTGSEFIQALGLHGATIQANPDKSKHLETVKAHIDGQEVDFVNLRSETYTDTRVPEMRMGTPEEDAKRRDLTINALFFNVETGQIEDYVGGQEDLKNMVLRTPLDPVQTFLDDPLRMLRVLRFHSRYGNSTVDPSIIEAMRLNEVREAFDKKVSPERSGKEFMKMMMGENPVSAVQILFDTNFYQNVFNVPEVKELKDIRMDQQNRHHKLNLMNHTLEVLRNLNQMMVENNETPYMRGLMNIAAVFHDFGKLHPEIQKPHPKDPTQMQYVGHEDASALIADSVLKNIGVGKNDRDLVSKVVALHMRPHAEDWSKRSMGRFLRDTEIKGQDTSKLWKYIMYHAMADSMAKGSDDYHEDVALKQKHMGQFEEYVTQRQQAPVSVAKPLLSGNEVMQLIPEIPAKTGFIKEVFDMLLQEQDAGEVADKEQAKAKVLEWKAENLDRYMKKSFNLKKIKTAMPETPTTDDFHPYEGSPGFGQSREQSWYSRSEYKNTDLEDYPDGIIHLKKYKDKVKSNEPAIIRDEDNDMVFKGDGIQISFRKGEKVRDRRRGIAQKQRYGRITSIKDNVYKIKWDGEIKEEEFRMNDTIGLAKVLAKV